MTCVVFKSIFGHGNRYFPSIIFIIIMYFSILNLECFSSIFQNICEVYMGKYAGDKNI